MDNFVSKNIKRKKISYLVLFTLIGLLLFLISVLIFKKLNTELNNKIINEHNQKIALNIEKNIFEKLESGVKALSLQKEVKDVIKKSNQPNNTSLMIALNTAKKIFNASIIYVMQSDGTVVGSTFFKSRGKLSSLLEENYKFRPYFYQAMRGKDTIFSAIGVTTKKRGIYFSSPVYDKNDIIPIGVVVIKMGFDNVDRMIKYYENPILLVSPDGIIFSSNKKEMLYKHIYPMSEKTVELIKSYKILANKKLLALESYLTTDYVKIKNKTYIVNKHRFPKNLWEVISLNTPDNKFSNKTIFKELFAFILIVLFGLLSIIYLLIINIIYKKNYQHKLEQSQNNYKTLYELAPDGICISSPEKVLSCNETFLNIFKYSMQELTTMHIKNLFFNPEKDRTFIVSEIKRKKIIKNYNVKFVDAYGVTINTLTSFALIEYQGEPCIEAFVKDISTLEKKDEQLKQSQKMHMIGSLASELVANFNNVLNGVTSTISILKYKLNNNEEIEIKELKKYINTIDFSGKRARDLVNQLLSLSKKKNPKNKVLELNQLLDRVVKSSRDNYEQFAVTFEKYGADAFIYAEESLVEQVFQNLSLNAYHATTIMKPQKNDLSGKLKIEINNFFADDYFCSNHPEANNQEYWEISFTDNGIGMNTNTASKIFEPFFTLKEKNKGIGLGLPISHSIIKQYGGFIDVASTPKEWSKFTVYLPTHQPNQIKDYHQHIYKGSGNILIIDDEKLMRDLACDILKECGYKTFSTKNGSSGLSFYEKKQKIIDIVILNMLMPDYTGKEVFIKLKELKPDIKVIITSGFKQDNRATELLEMGALGFIQKPYSIEILSKIIKENI